MGWKKALDVREGTWLREVRLGDRPSAELVVLVPLPLFPTALKFFLAPPHTLDEAPVLAVSGRITDPDSLVRCVLGPDIDALPSPSSSLAMSVMWEDTTLPGRCSSGLKGSGVENLFSSSDGAAGSSECGDTIVMVPYVQFPQLVL
jgi:hypothetical protein